MFRDNKNAILFVTAVFLSIWIWGSKPGLGQKQEDTRFTVETHDKTNFPLIGRHRTVSCGECHLHGALKGTPTDCEACHWVRRQDDRHQLRLGLHCGDCHTPFSWKNVGSDKWNHLDAVGYSLEGMHKTLDCVDCHGEDGFLRSVIDCFDCHEEEFSKAKNPDHRAAGFPTQCQLCHQNNTRWEGAVFSHSSFDRWGKHKLAECADCHVAAQYPGLSSACVSCHLNDYNSAGDPDHKASGFPTECEVCHGTRASSWEDADFSHTSFPLAGQHKVAQCSDCHASGIYIGLPSDCVSCHLDDYSSADDPDHKASGFPTDCTACHGTGIVNWQTVIFDHSSYWTLRGAHSTLDCASCHEKGYNLPRDCYGCHAQDYENTTNPDHSIAEFPTDCELCHYPTHFLWSQAVFDHDFPLGSGNHASASCSDCHISSNYKQFSCLTCHTHDKTRMDNEHQGVAGYVYESQACYACHPQGRE